MSWESSRKYARVYDMETGKAMHKDEEALLSTTVKKGDVIFTHSCNLIRIRATSPEAARRLEQNPMVIYRNRYVAAYEKTLDVVARKNGDSDAYDCRDFLRSRDFADWHSAMEPPYEGNSWKASYQVTSTSSIGEMLVGQWHWPKRDLREELSRVLKAPDDVDRLPSPDEVQGSMVAIEDAYRNQVMTEISNFGARSYYLHLLTKHLGVETTRPLWFTMPDPDFYGDDLRKLREDPEGYGTLRTQYRVDTILTPETFLIWEGEPDPKAEKSGLGSLESDSDESDAGETRLTTMVDNDVLAKRCKPTIYWIASKIALRDAALRRKQHDSDRQKKAARELRTQKIRTNLHKFTREVNATWDSTVETAAAVTKEHLLDWKNREGKLFPERKTVSREALRAANKELYSSGTQLRKLITTEDVETAAELRRATRAVLRQARKLDRIQVDPEDWKTRFTKGGLADGYYSNP